jgi:hypothetical protein
LDKRTDENFSFLNELRQQIRELLRKTLLVLTAVLLDGIENQIEVLLTRFPVRGIATGKRFPIILPSES